MVDDEQRHPALALLRNRRDEEVEVPLCPVAVDRSKVTPDRCTSNFLMQVGRRGLILIALQSLAKSNWSMSCSAISTPVAPVKPTWALGPVTAGMSTAYVCITLASVFAPARGSGRAGAPKAGWRWRRWS